MEEGMGQVKCQLTHLMPYFWKFCVLEKGKERGEFFPTEVKQKHPPPPKNPQQKPTSK